MRFSDRWKDAVLLAAGILIGLAFLNAYGTEDRGRWIIYIDLARKHGLFGTYPFAVFNNIAGGSTDYPPLSIMFLAGLSRVADHFRLTDFTTLKLSLIPFTLACAYVVAAWHEGRQGRLFGVAMFALLTLNALLLAYIDVYFLMFFLIALYCLERGWFGTAALMFVISVLVKWQPIILLPFVILYLWPRCTFRGLVRFAPAILLLFAALAGYGSAMAHAFISGMQEPTLSGRALNFNWLVTARAELHWPGYALPDGEHVKTMNLALMQRHFLPDRLRYYLIALDLSSALRYVCYGVAFLYFLLSKREFTDFLRASTIAFFAYCTFGMAVHESHSLLPAVLALCWFAVDRTRWLEAIVLAGIFNLNLLIFYGIDGDGPGFSTIVFNHDVTIWLAAFDVAFFAIMWLPMALETVRSLRSATTRAA